jgi:hypothetical protein
MNTQDMKALFDFKTPIYHIFAIEMVPWTLRKMP